MDVDGPLDTADLGFWCRENGRLSIPEMAFDWELNVHTSLFIATLGTGTLG